MSRKVAVVDDLATVRRFQSEVASVREAEEPYAIRMTVHVLLAAILISAFVAVFAKIDRVIVSEGGKVVANVKPIVFQALDDFSIIRSINVRAGDRVVKGQLLATIDPTFSSADVQQLRDQIDSLDAEIARCVAEQQGHAPVFATGGPPVQKYVALQRRFYEERQGQYKAQLDSFDEKIKQAQATIAQSLNDVERYKQRDVIAAKVDEMKAQLLAKGAGSLLNKLIAQDAQVEIQRQQEFAGNSAVVAQHQLDSIRADRETYVKTWANAISQELVTARNSRDTAEAQLEKANKHKELVQIVAPDDALVMDVTKLSVGSVLKSADQIMTLTPLSSPMDVELKISTRDVGFLRVGDPVTIKVDAFEYTRYGFAEGRVKSIGADTFTIDEDTGQVATPYPYYRVFVTIDKMDFVNVPKNFALVPGMTLQGDIKVGRRTIGSYVWGAMARGGGEAMREP